MTVRTGTSCSIPMNNTMPRVKISCIALMVAMATRNDIAGGWACKLSIHPDNVHRALTDIRKKRHD